MNKRDYGDMDIGLMCMECGYLTYARDLFWIPAFRYDGDEPDEHPTVHLKCPECGVVDPENVTFMILETEHI
jgi:uncharacterized Zn finger protein